MKVSTNGQPIGERAMKSDRVTLYDTTLRDGTQGEGVSLSCDDKLRIARRLDEFGMDYIEGGLARFQPQRYGVL